MDIAYQPRALALETKNLKLYLETFRDVGIFHEHLATLICGDIVKHWSRYRRR